MESRENSRRGKNQDMRVKNGEKREPWMEWDGEIWAGPRGVYIRLGSALVWQREMWVHLEVIHHLYQGKLQEVDGPASRYVSVLPVSFLLPLPLPFIFIWKHEQMWGKQQISAVWLLACSFQLLTDKHRGPVVPNYQGGGSCRAPVLSPRGLKFLMFTSSCFSLSLFFFSFQRCWTWNLWLIFILYVSWRRKKNLVWNTGLILYKLQESCRAVVLIASSMPLNLERKQQG